MLSKQVPFRLPLTKAKVAAATTRADTTTKVVMTNQDMISHMTPITVDMVVVMGATMVLMGISNKQHQLLQGGVVLVVVRLEVVGVAAGLHKLQVIERVH